MPRAQAGLASRQDIPVFYNTCFMKPDTRAARFRAFSQFRAYLRNAFPPMALRAGDGTELPPP